MPHSEEFSCCSRLTIKVSLRFLRRDQIYFVPEHKNASKKQACRQTLIWWCFETTTKKLMLHALIWWIIAVRASKSPQIEFLISRCGFFYLLHSGLRARSGNGDSSLFIRFALIIVLSLCNECLNCFPSLIPSHTLLWRVLIYLATSSVASFVQEGVCGACFAGTQQCWSCWGNKKDIEIKYLSRHFIFCLL